MYVNGTNTYLRRTPCTKQDVRYKGFEDAAFSSLENYNGLTQRVRCTL